MNKERRAGCEVGGDGKTPAEHEREEMRIKRRMGKKGKDRFLSS